jgi:hypothetical protein
LRYPCDSAEIDRSGRYRKKRKQKQEAVTSR